MTRLSGTGARYLPQNPPVTPKTRTPRRPTWRTVQARRQRKQTWHYKVGWVTDKEHGNAVADGV